MPNDRELERIRQYVKQRIAVTASGCWDWLRRIDKCGYGRAYLPVTIQRKNHQIIEAHRLSYLVYVGAIPNKFHLDHLCLNKKCVNPAHLEPVSITENNRRTKGIRPSARSKSETKDYFCKRGHLLTLETTYQNGPNRTCAACKKIRAQSYKGTGK